jgi:hypothetical protein
MKKKGIINKSGETLNFHRIASRVSRTYNLSPALAVQLLSAAWPLFKDRGQIDLYSLTTHGLIEHDASLLRQSFIPSAHFWLALSPMTYRNLLGTYRSRSQ